MIFDAVVITLSFAAGAAPLLGMFWSDIQGSRVAVGLVSVLVVAAAILGTIAALFLSISDDSTKWMPIKVIALYSGLAVPLLAVVAGVIAVRRADVRPALIGLGFGAFPPALMYLATMLPR